MRVSALFGVGFLLCGWAILGAEDPPREWIEPATGHRVIRLSERPGTASLYFHQNAYTASRRPDGRLHAARGCRRSISRRARSRRSVEGRASHLVVGRKTRQVFYIQNDTVYATHLDTRVDAQDPVPSAVAYRTRASA